MYLVWTVGRFAEARRAEEHGREKHERDNKTMINPDLDEIKTATKEHWVHNGTVVGDVDGNIICDCRPRTNGYGKATARAAFIVAARNVLPELVDEIERLNKDLGELSEENERLSVALKLAQALCADRKSEVEWLKAELEAAKRDMGDMFRAECREDLCEKCKSHKVDAFCMIGNCDNAEWRGVTENGGQDA